MIDPCFCIAQGESVAEALDLGIDPAGKSFESRIAFRPTPLDLSSDGGGITAEGAFIVLNIDAAFTAGIAPGLYPFDVFMSGLDGVRTQVRSGLVRVNQAVTPIS
jgi:hypothetical protein